MNKITMESGLHHPNYAIMTLEKESINLKNASKGWSESSKTEYQEAWKQISKEIKQLDKAIEFLKATSI